MTHSKLTNQISLSSQSSSRDGAKIDRFLVHHAAGTSQEDVVNMMVRGTRTVSANYVVGDTITLVVDEDRRAWTSGSKYDGGKGAAFDKRSITVETINNSTKNWTVSDETFDNLAWLIADVATRYEFPINDDTVLTHQELWTRFRASYPTACPGDLQRRKAELLTLARKYQTGKATGATTAPSTSKPASTAASSTTATAAQWKTIQAWLKRLGRYSGPADGVPGVNTWKGIQRTVRDRAGYTGPIDGKPGVNTYKAMQRYAQGGGYTGPVDGVLGANSWAGFVKRLSS
ncbi:N-acetylmuramoyl-L-alanine amidase [Gulosibacter massiliensis]|uniref:N-acetylmuramoyl-L-alanine amidase n=1 Tax=Gulosibacter massiliensis TaxID=2479839 RepID=UPI0013DDEB11|nr:N-acetylmuramoyl-L-alanine amidase [Gulosibacter massiliensis]